MGVATRLVHHTMGFGAQSEPRVPGEQFFTLTGPAQPHPLFNDEYAAFRDIQNTASLLTDVGSFIGHRYFDVPENRQGVFYRFDMNVTAVGRWRADHRQAADTRLRVRPSRVIHRVPRSLDLGYEDIVDGAPTCAGSAGLVFLAPVLHSTHVRLSRGRALGSAHRSELPELSRTPVPPNEVGQSDPRNVVVGEPTESGGGRQTVQVLIPPQHRVLRAEEGGTPGQLLIETLRQSSLLAACRMRGLTPGGSALSALSAQFRGYAELDMPLRCTAVVGEWQLDANGRAAVPVTLTLSQLGRAVAEATSTVLEDV